MNRRGTHTVIGAVASALVLPLAACGTSTGSNAGPSSADGTSTTRPVTTDATRDATPAAQSTAASTPGHTITATTMAPAPPAPTTVPTSQAPETPQADQGEPSAALPVYYAGATDGADLRLYREFVPARGLGKDAAARTDAALAQAISHVPRGYSQLWDTSITARSERTKDGITITLSKGASDLPATNAQAAVNQLVWTATAGYGVDVPVTFVVEGGGKRLYGDLTTDRTYRRPPSGIEQTKVLAPIWIDTPGYDGEVPKGKVTASGTASVFEATVTWRLAKSGQPLRRGVAMASVAAPERGAWKADIGDLAPGTYTLTVAADDPSGRGSGPSTEHTFTVR